MKNNKLSTTQLTILGLMTAILLLMSYTPLGYLNIGPLAITFNVIPVAIAAITCGPVGGLIVGSVFGLTSFGQCIGIGGDQLLFIPLHDLLLQTFNITVDSGNTYFFIDAVQIVLVPDDDPFFSFRDLQKISVFFRHLLGCVKHKDHKLRFFHPRSNVRQCRGHFIQGPFAESV